MENLAFLAKAAHPPKIDGEAEERYIELLLNYKYRGSMPEL
jgi:hypothetical protein